MPGGPDGIRQPPRALSIPRPRWLSKQDPTPGQSRSGTPRSAAPAIPLREIDATQLPLGAVALHQEGGVGDPVTKVTVDIHHPVRIVLVPATQPH